ncbi:MAG TPA: AAA family ATPase, partial [Thermoanaerobaculia bacterium]|nr:AAA family ATPase [Thermoanaerobaculia bacterium]
MARRPGRVFTCTACDAQSPRWLGRCPECGGWNTFVEGEPERPARPGERAPATTRSPILRMQDVDATDSPRLLTGLADVDRVLGGGLVPGSVVLLGGEPGIGKSTLLLQVAARLVAHAGQVLYVSAEESARQVRLRADRLGAVVDGLHLLAETS